MVNVPAYYYTKMLVEYTPSWRLKTMNAYASTKWNALL